MHDDKKISEFLSGNEHLKDIAKGAITLLARGHAKWIKDTAKAQGVEPCDVKIKKSKKSDKKKAVSEHEKMQASRKNKKTESSGNKQHFGTPLETRNPLNLGIDE